MRHCDWNHLNDMNRWWLGLVSMALVVFAYFVATFLFFVGVTLNQYGVVGLPIYFSKQHQLTQISNIWESDGASLPASESSRRLDLMLPKAARVFMLDMTGATNGVNAGNYFFLTYYLFPREVAVSVDQPARITQDGFIGRPSQSDAELLANGFDVAVDMPNYGKHEISVRLLHDFPLKQPVNPDWFRSPADAMIAFLLPLLTALSGLSLLRLLSPALNGQMPLTERLACGLGLGMAALAALTLGVKLCGFHGGGLALVVTGAGSLLELWRGRRDFLSGLTGGFWRVMHSPVAMVGVLVFCLIFRLAMLEGLAEYDSVTGWMLKAKIIHLGTGNEIVRWFSNPRLAHAHLDYPTLVPSLHAATFDSLGHVNEFVTKFWPAWMLLLLIGALASLNRGWKGRIPGPAYFILALVLIPDTQVYVMKEGGTLPLVFYTVLGFLQCAIWQVEKDRARLGLGLTLLFCAAMTKFEGFIFLVLAGSWLLLLPALRPSLKPSPQLWRGLGFCFLVALPFLGLRLQIPVLHYESNWAGYALHHPGATLSNCPWIFILLLARFFVSSDLASWSDEDGTFHWIGRWDGLSSLYDHPTLGLAWVCLLMTVALWFVVPARRQFILWMLAVFVSTLAVFSLVFASFVSITSLNVAMSYTKEELSGRYLLPILFAWAAVSLTLLFGYLPPPASVPNANAPTRSALAPDHPPAGGKRRSQGSAN